MPASRTRVTRLVFAALTLASTPLYAQEVTLKVSHFLPPNSNYQKGVLEPWCDKLAKDSGGRLKCQIYPAMQLGGTPPQLADQVKNAVADIVMTSPSYSSGRFPYTEALEQPFTLPPGGLAGSKAMWEYSQKFAMKDYADFKLLAMFTGSGIIMSTASKPILNVDGFKGVKLRSPSRSAAKLLTALGGAPANMPPAQITEAVAKGVVDGAMATWELVPAVKLQEVTKYHMEGPANQPAFTQNPLVMLMNKVKHDGLPCGAEGRARQGQRPLPGGTGRLGLGQGHRRWPQDCRRGRQQDPRRQAGGLRGDAQGLGLGRGGVGQGSGAQRAGRRDAGQGGQGHRWEASEVIKTHRLGDSHHG